MTMTMPMTMTPERENAFDSDSPARVSDCFPGGMHGILRGRMVHFRR